MTGEDFAQAVALGFGVGVDDVLARCRKQRCTRPRFAAYWLARNLPCDDGRQRSLAETGRLFGRDHATVIYGIAQAELLLADAAFVAALAQAGELLAGQAAPTPAEESRHPAVLDRRVKPKNEPAANDGDALARFRGAVALLAAIRREHPERCAA